MLIRNVTINVLFLIIADCSCCEKLYEVCETHKEAAVFFILTINLVAGSYGPLLTIIGPVTCPLLHAIRVSYLDQSLDAKVIQGDFTSSNERIGMTIDEAGLL